MVAVLYMVIGLALGWIVREVFYVPHDFHYGILVVSSSVQIKVKADLQMAILSNWGMSHTLHEGGKLISQEIFQSPSHRQ
jgi:hypothetical protein